jgi:hypothetical protein
MPTTKRTVIAKSYVNIREEIVAAGVITPGHLIEKTSAGKVQAHSTAAGVAQKMFALEDGYQGNGIATNYAADDTVHCWTPVPGEKVNAIAGGTVAVGDFLVSAGNGRVSTAVQDSAGVAEFAQSIVGIAEEASTVGVAFRIQIV